MMLNWSATSRDYLRYRPGYPKEFFVLLRHLDIGLVGQDILDLGSGTGALAVQFARQGARVTAVDPSEGQIQAAKTAARAYGVKIKFKVVSAEKTELPDHAFDAITASMCWGYFDIKRMRWEVPRLLRPGGLLLVSTLLWDRRNPQFNRETLQLGLRQHGISYVFLGEELGARRSEPECYVRGKADYLLIAQTPAFIRGLDRLVQGVAKMRIAILCAEKDPLDCHRCILVSPRLKERGISVQHIHDDGTLESQEEVERRLAKKFNLVESGLFQPDTEILVEAYRRQGEKIAYQKS